MLLWLKQASLLTFNFSPQHRHPFQVDEQPLYAPWLLIGWEENGHAGKRTPRLAATAIIMYHLSIGWETRLGKHFTSQCEGGTRLSYPNVENKKAALPTQALTTHGAKVKKLLHSPLNSLLRVLPCPLPSSCAFFLCNLRSLKLAFLALSLLHGYGRIKSILVRSWKNIFQLFILQHSLQIVQMLKSNITTSTQTF